MLQPITFTRPITVAATIVASLWAAGALAHTAGLQRLSVPYHGTQIDVALWYPAAAPEARIEAGPFSTQAAGGADITAGRHPLLLLSHGTGGMNLNHHPLASALARAGYMVAAPTHPGDNFRDRSLIADPRYWGERPRQLSIVLDALLGSARFGASIDRDRIGAIGHSAGGYGVAALVGLHADRQRLNAHCRHSDDPSCAYADPDYGVSNPRPDPLKLPDSVIENARVADSRIRSVALLAPLGAVLADDARARPEVSLLMLIAERDQVLPANQHARRISALAPSIEVETVSGAGHFSFMAPVDARWRPMLGMIAEDPEGFDRQAFQPHLANRLIQWFDENLTKH
ncbi:MAG: hypothetical protein R3E83_15010 [Burkholderiaceae bacterium]